MKIGLITMHWGRNYGAVIQAYAMQEYLESLGHSVEIINYKPYQFDVNYLSYLTHPWRIVQLKEVLPKELLDKKLRSFRTEYLHQTARYGSYEELKTAKFDYDVFMTGSDQILNPSLTMNGDGKPAPVYYLGFAPDDRTKVGYAVSFGCTVYPENAKQYATPWITNFQQLGVREDSGMDIIKSFNYSNYSTVVPDPTVLLGSKLFDKFNLHQTNDNGDYYFIHTLRSRSINFACPETRCVESAKSPAMEMDKWLNKIYNAKALITNSYHAMIMALLMHKNFVVILEKGRMTGMNDRFYTLLSRIGLNNRISVNDKNSIDSVLSLPISWEDVDRRMEEFRKMGVDYIEKCLNITCDES